MTVGSLLAFAVVGAVAGCATSTSQPKFKASERPGTDAAAVTTARAAAGQGPSLKIYDETITVEDIWRGLDDELVTQARTRTPAGLESYVAQRAGQLIRDRIAETLLARQAKLRMPEDFEERLSGYVDAEIRKIVTRDHNGSQTRYEKWLSENSQTLDGVRAQLRRDILVSSHLDQELRPKVLEPTRAELYDLYQTSLETLRRPPRRRMALIESRVGRRLPPDAEQPTHEQVAAARAEALAAIHAARDALAAGAAFADAARQYSDGLHAQEGGEWGWITKDSVRERFAPAVDALFELEVGETSGIVEGGDAYFLVRCLGIDEPETPDFETLQPELADRHFKMQYNRLIVEHVDELREKAHLPQDALDRFFAAVIDAGVKRGTTAQP